MGYTERQVGSWHFDKHHVLAVTTFTFQQFKKKKFVQYVSPAVYMLQNFVWKNKDIKSQTEVDEHAQFRSSFGRVWNRSSPVTSEYDIRRLNIHNP